MKSNYKKLAPYIRLIDERNTEDIHYELLGVSVDKCFIKSIANTVGTDWRGYKKIRRGQFCYIPDTSRRGDKIGIALLCDYDIALVSQAYTVFEISDTANLLPEYLNLWFKRPEFDRYARFHSHGSVREIFDWEEMGNVTLPIPSIEEQQKIVDAYNAIERRIAIKRQINDNLELQAKSLFIHAFVKNDNEWNTPLTEIINLLGGGTPKTDNPFYWDGEIPFFTPKDVSDSLFCICTEKALTEEGLKNCSSKLYPAYTVFITCRGTVGNIVMAAYPMAMNQSCYAIQGKNKLPPFFIYELMRYVIATMKQKAVGAVFNALVTNDFNMENVFRPAIIEANEFETQVKPIFDTILNNSIEIKGLRDLQNNLLTLLSR